MATFPAFCPNCGLIFPVAGLNLSNVIVEIRGAVQDCPRCGAEAALPDGTFDVGDETVEVLAASELTRERLFRLRMTLEAAQAGEISQEEAARTIAEEAPELASLIERLRPKMGRALFHLLALVVSITLSQIVAEHRNDAATKADVQRAFEQAIERCQAETP